MVNNNESPIGFLDSGVGGVTVLSKALQLLPNENYYFYSDSINNPYGDKPDEEIISICDKIVDKLINVEKCKAIVIACNTASAKAAKFLREKYVDVPIVAIEPAYKMVNDINPNGKTLVMATRGTIESEKFHRLYIKYNNHCTSLLSCVGMADLIEQSRFEELDEYLEKTIGEYRGVENVVLGCTHYPIAKENIKKVLGDVKFFDGAEGVSRQLKRILEQNNVLNSGVGGEIKFYDTSSIPNVKKDTFFNILKNYK